MGLRPIMRRMAGLRTFGCGMVLVASIAAAQPRTVELRDGATPFTSYNGTRDITLDRKSDRPWSPSTNYSFGENWVHGSENRAVLTRWDVSPVPANATVED